MLSDNSERATQSANQAKPEESLMPSSTPSAAQGVPFAPSESSTATPLGDPEGNPSRLSRETRASDNEKLKKEVMKMQRKNVPVMVIAIGLLSFLSVLVLADQDRYALQVPNGLAFSEFRGYEDWQVVAPSQTGALKVVRVILANPVLINAYRAGVPGNGQPFPDGSKMVKLVWKQKEITTAPFSASTPDTVPATLEDVEFMEKDGKRFADSGGWGWGVFEYDATSDTFRPGNLTDKPPQGNDAKCGFACHTIAKANDYVFTAYAKR